MKRQSMVYGMRWSVILMSAVALLSGSAVNNVSGQLVLAGTNYTQTFDGVGTGLPPGWSVRTNATAVSLGTGVTFTTNATSWSTTSGQFANYASTINQGTNFSGSENSAIQSACTNRCLGIRQTGSIGDPGAAFVLQIQNTLGFAGFELSLDLNLLRSEPNRSNSWTVDYAVGNSPSSFTPAWISTDPGAFGTTTTTISFGTALDNQAENIWIRVAALEISAGSGNRDVFGIDNFKLNFEAGNSISPIPLNLHLMGTNAVLTWDNPAFALQSAPTASGVYTSIPAATSPYTNPVNGSQQYFRLKAN